MQYDFDEVINRYGTNSVKWDFADVRLGAKGTLPMWVADMDFRAPRPIIDACKKVAEHGIFGYSAFPSSYFTAVIDWMRRRHRWDIKQEWMVFTPGVVPAINMAVKAFTGPGDEVIVQTPGYFPFFNAIRNNRRAMLDNPLRLENGRYVMDLADLERKISPRTKLLLLCSPQNPGGRVWTREELIGIGELCLKHNITVVSDEIHGDIVYRGYRHTPFATISPEFADSSITCTGVSKTFNLPGLHMSNIIISNPLLRQRFSDTLTSCAVHFPNIFGIAATEAAYRYGEPWLDELLVYLEGNLDFLQRYLAERIPSITMLRPQGTYLAWLDCRGLPVGPEQATKFLHSQARVGVEDGNLFGCHETGFERMNIACPRSLLQEALERIEAAVKSL